MKKLVLLLLITFLSSTLAYAEQNNTNPSLGGYIWYDKNLDGIQDYGEHQVQRVRVELVKDGKNTGVVKYSDDSGNYLFENLEANHKYAIRVALPKNYKSFTHPNRGNDDTKDSDIIRVEKEKVDINGTLKDLVVGYSEEVLLHKNEHIRDLDVGMLCRCIAWIDVEKSTNGKDADYSDEAVEVKVGDEITWEYNVSNSSLVKISEIKLTDDKEGDIDCPKDSLEPGESMICTKKGVAQKGLYRNLAKVTGKDTHGNVVDDEDPSNYIAKSNLACLGDYYWYDENLNGVQDKNEYGVVGIKVELYDENKNLLDTTKTDNNGKYLFCGLEPGNYYVKFGLPDTYLFVPKDRGSDIRDSDADNNGWSHLVKLKDGAKDLTIDAGIYCSCQEYEVTGKGRKISASALNPALALFLIIIMAFIAFTINPDKKKGTKQIKRF
jgi:hypothetical protein